ncbi:M15 family metallopeptidase [Piscinibacter gummiphilus]|uniref:M15 family metallopeptidase n=1 Tax=Piscinibacter gummiphilus TaxID=946333 RepID=A0ABZ0D1P0_9BURK|nr:M15 family metallopeptidase [Piscinibacter gummiphilus]WOB11060.1 M15 family metallopeptidase [Piscinibacter gummiphilus]
MWIAIVVVYFVGACALAALLLLPAFREGVMQHISTWRQRLAGVQQRAQGAATRNAREGYAQAASSTRWVQRHAIPLSIAVALLSLPPVIVFSLRALHTLDAYDDTTTAQADSVIATLLQGEQLVPPPPLPPEVFTTAEVELVRPKLSTADRRWDLLDADFRQRLLLAYRLMREEHGYEMALIEGYRSPERQTLLASMGAHVTNAAAWQSYHQHGLAADSAFMRNGKLVISERDPWAAKGYELYGEVAQRVGLTWGGRWQNADLGHVELRKPNVHRPKVGA